MNSSPPNFPSKLSAHLKVAGYRILRELERGGMGEILLARELETDREVVIKWISASDSGERGPEWKRRLEKETLVLSQIDHEHVVSVLNSGADSEHAWLAMEFVEGGTLRDRIDAANGLPRAEVRRLLRELGSALGALHVLEIVHRDLKPENILLDADGRVKIADFGLATPLGDVGNLTVTGQVLGTADYLSPEQKYRLPVDERSDQYALAVVAYELLTGRKPLGSFSGPSEKNPSYSNAVDAACLRALSEDPEDRFETTSEFIETLDAALAVPRKIKFIERPVPVIAGAVALGILIAGAWGFNDRAPKLVPDQQASSAAPGAAEANTGSAQEVIVGGKPPSLLRPDGLSQEDVDKFNRLMAQAMQFGNGGQWSLSLKKCDEALVVMPHSSQAHFNRGCALHGLMRLEEASQAYAEAIELDPKNGRAFGNRGYLRETSQDYDGAFEDYEAAIVAEPSVKQHHENRISLLKRRERYGEVIEAFEAWLEIDPSDSETLGSLAYWLCVCPEADAVDLERGLQVAEELCEAMEWSHWRPLKVLAIAQHLSGLHEEGLESAMRCVELSEDDRREEIRDSLTYYFPKLAED